MRTTALDGRQVISDVAARPAMLTAETNCRTGEDFLATPGRFSRCSSRKLLEAKALSIDAPMANALRARLLIPDGFRQSTLRPSGACAADVVHHPCPQ
jgi:hypothetical protein